MLVFISIFALIGGHRGVLGISHEKDKIVGNIVTHYLKSFRPQVGMWTLTQEIGFNDISNGIATCINEIEKMFNKLEKFKDLVNKGHINDIISQRSNSTATEEYLTWAQIKVDRNHYVKIKADTLITELEIYSGILSNEHEHHIQKRHILSFLGNIISAVTDLPSREELNKIEKGYNLIVDRETDILHNFDDSLTLINSTRVVNKEQTRKINSLVEKSNNMSAELDEIILSEEHIFDILKCENRISEFLTGIESRIDFWTLNSLMNPSQIVF